MFFIDDFDTQIQSDELIERIFQQEYLFFQQEFFSGDYNEEDL